MPSAQPDSDARGRRSRLIGLLFSATVYATSIAHAQTNSALSAGGPAPAGTISQPAGATAQSPSTPEGTDLGLPSLRLSGFQMNAGATASEIYTTNPLGVPNNYSGAYSRSEFFTSLGLYWNAHDHTPKFNGDLSYTLTGNIYTSHPQYNSVYNYLTALANAVLVQERLFLHASAFASPLLLNSLGPLNASAANSGLRNTYGYSISPELRFRVGDIAISDASFSQSGLFFGDTGGITINQTVPGVQQAPESLVSYGGSESISSGRDFSRLNWQLNGSDFKAVETGLDFNQASTTAIARYAIDHAFALTSRFGYQWFTSNQAFTQSVSGPVAMGGFLFRPSPNLRADFSAGYQFNSASYVGDLFYQFAPFTSLQGSLTDGIATPLGQLTGNLTNLGVNGAGDFYNTNYQLNPTTPPSTVSPISTFNPAPLGWAAFTSNVFRYRYGDLSLVHIAGRTQFRLTGYTTRYDAVTRLPAGTPASGQALGGQTIGAQFTVSRSLTPRLTAAASLDYGSWRDLGIRYDTLFGNLNVNYSISATMQFFATAAYTQRDTGGAGAAISPLSGSLTGTSISVGIHKQLL